jgi:hypothetical protein
MWVLFQKGTTRLKIIFKAAHGETIPKNLVDPLTVLLKKALLKILCE